MLVDYAGITYRAWGFKVQAGPVAGANGNPYKAWMKTSPSLQRRASCLQTILSWLLLRIRLPVVVQPPQSFIEWSKKHQS